MTKPPSRWPSTAKSRAGDGSRDRVSMWINPDLAAQLKQLANLDWDSYQGNFHAVIRWACVDHLMREGARLNNQAIMTAATREKKFQEVQAYHAKAEEVNDQVDYLISALENAKSFVSRQALLKLARDYLGMLVDFPDLADTLGNVIKRMS